MIVKACRFRFKDRPWIAGVLIVNRNNPEEFTPYIIPEIGSEIRYSVVDEIELLDVPELTFSTDSSVKEKLNYISFQAPAGTTEKT